MLAREFTVGRIGDARWLVFEAPCEISPFATCVEKLGLADLWEG